MRTEGVFRVVLNTPVFKGMKVGDNEGKEPSGKMITLAGVENGKAVPLLLRVKTVTSLRKTIDTNEELDRQSTVHEGSLRQNPTIAGKAMRRNIEQITLGCRTLAKTAFYSALSYVGILLWKKTQVNSIDSERSKSSQDLIHRNGSLGHHFGAIVCHCGRSCRKSYHQFSAGYCFICIRRVWNL